MANNPKKYASDSTVSAIVANIKQSYVNKADYDTALANKADKSHNHNDLYYTESEINTKLDAKVPTSRTINNKPLTANISLSASDVGAAPSTHNHDDRYYTESEVDSKLSNKSDKTHNHDTVYAGIDHDHNDAYAVVDHDHDNDYAAKTHNHDNDYYTQVQIDSKLSGKSDTTHNHDTLYAAKTHNHDGVYATSGHNHDTKYDAKGAAAAVQTNLDTVSDTLDAHTSNTDIHFTSDERDKLKNIQAGAQVNTITGVKGNSESSYRTGNVNITKANIGLGNVDNTADSAKTVKHAATADSATSATSATKATQDGNGKVISSTYETKTDAESKLATAKQYTDTAISNLINSAPSTLDTLGEIATAMQTNGNVVEALDAAVGTKANASDLTSHTLNKSNPHGVTKSQVGLGNVENKSSATIRGEITKSNVTTALGYTPYTPIEVDTKLSGKADSIHSHAINEVNGLQSALDGKANSSHGTHVAYSTTAPVMDGTASVGTASTVARSDHKHPTDTSRAAQTDLDALEAVVAGKANATHSHAISDVTNLQSTLDSKTNQNAFSNVKVGSTTIAADTVTDTLTLEGSNVTITPDATNDKVTISVAEASTSGKGIVQLTNSTSSTSTTTAATPNSVKSAYDLANQAKTAASNAQTDIDEVKDTYLPLAGGTVTGTTIFNKVQDSAADSYNAPAVVIGGDPTTYHLELDNNEIQAKMSETKAGNLFLNSNGGIVHVGFGGLTMDSESAIRPEFANSSSIGTAELPFNHVYGRYFNLYGDANTQYGRFRVATTGTTSTAGSVDLILGNNKATGTAHNASGKITMYGSGTAFTNIMPSDRTSGSNAVKLPTGSGTLALEETSTKVATMTNAEYNALTTEQIDANTLYMITDEEEPIIPQIQFVTWEADD